MLEDNVDLYSNPDPDPDRDLARAFGLTVLPPLLLVVGHARRPTN